MKKKIIAIGDVHGLNTWKEIVNAPENKKARFVFMGDYIDPYDDIGTDDLIANISDIIRFKKIHKSNAILLLGNHDMHYLYNDFPKSTRYDFNIAKTYKNLIEENRGLFLFAYQEGKTLFTHAGITNGWWNNNFIPLLHNGQVPIKDGIIHVATLLNNASSQQLKVMSQVGCCRGGDEDYGGIFWEDKIETSFDPLVGFHQVVGHTRVSSAQTYNIDDDTQITFCDCLSNGIAYELKC